MPREVDYTQETAEALLDDYIWPEECDAHTLPRDLKVTAVSEFIRDRLTEGFGPLVARRAMDVVRYYALRDHMEQLEGLLSGGEETVDDLERSCWLIVALSEMGTPAQQRVGVAEFDRLVADPLAEQEDALGRLIETFFSLAPKAAPSPVALSERVEAVRKKCERNGPESELWRYVHYEARLLPWVTREKSRKDWLLSMPDDEERVRRFAEAYLMFGMDTPYKWDRQAGFALLQLGRLRGDGVVVAGLAGAMDRIDPEKDSEEAVRFRKTRGYRAREYFLDELDKEQREDRGKFNAAQDDLIV